ncbi:phosphatidylinositol 4-kinase beta 1-like [Wolffia australiana]
MVRLLGLGRFLSDESPREINGDRDVITGVGESGWLVRFFDSAFFCEWIAVSYLYKHDHPGVRDYLCNRMYTLPLHGIECYLFQICYMLVHKPSPSLDRFVIDVCSKSLKIALKVHWFLLAELEDTEDNEGISRIQEKCQIAATLMAEWPPLLHQRSPTVESSSVFNRILSSGQKLRSLASSPSPTRENSENDCVGSEENSHLFKKLIPGTKVRDALFFRKSVDREGDGKGKEVEDSEKEGFFRRLIRESKDKEEMADKDGFFKRLMKEVKDEDEEPGPSSDGFFKRLFKDKEERLREEGEGEGFFKRIFRDKSEEKSEAEERFSGGNDEEESLDFLSFRRLFRVHPEEARAAPVGETGGPGSSLHSSPGTENFFKRLFWDRDRSVEDAELLGSRKSKEKCPGSPKQRDDKSNAKPPLPNMISQFRKETYHDSLEFVQSLCDTSYNLVEVFPMEDRKVALRESLVEINSTLAAAQNSGGICFPMGKGMYQVVHIPIDEAVLLNSRDKAPFLICVEVLKAEYLSRPKEAPNARKVAKTGIPLANGDAQLPKPPPWAYPLWNSGNIHHQGEENLFRSASDAIDQAMAHLWEAKVKLVHVSLAVQKTSEEFNSNIDGAEKKGSEQTYCDSDVWGVPQIPGPNNQSEMEWVRVGLSAVPGVNMEDVSDPEPPRRKEHRRVPSTVAIEEVKAAAAKGHAPPGLPLKGAAQDSTDTEGKVLNSGTFKAVDALSGELWEVKKQRIRNSSTFGKSPGWDLRSMIVKSGDDCRQEHLAVQLVSHFYDIFQETGLPLWLRPYEVLVTSSYTALIETISDTASLHSIKSRFPYITSLRDFFNAKYGENTSAFKLAQRNFVESMAGYSILCYLLQVKDRHNGNLLLDEEGHIIHIDFGFMLSNSPGGVNFESAPFKLTRELLEVMDSDAEGNPSEFFDYFKVLCIQGFLTCRKHAERIILLVEMFQDSGFPCFKGGPRTIQNLRKRFHLGLTEEQCVSLVLSLISNSLDAWRTRQYDYYQRVLNGIL